MTIENLVREIKALENTASAWYAHVDMGALPYNAAYIGAIDARIRKLTAIRDKWMRQEDFDGLLFVQSITCDGATARITINGRDAVMFDVTVEATSCDALSFNDPDYDGDSGVYETGYGVTINGGSDDAIECTFRTLEECIDFVNYETLPMEGYVI